MRPTCGNPTPQIRVTAKNPSTDLDTRAADDGARAGRPRRRRPHMHKRAHAHASQTHHGLRGLVCESILAWLGLCFPVTI